MHASRIPRRSTAILSMLFATALGAACGGDDADSLAADSALERDLSLMPTDPLLELRDSAPLNPPPTRATAPVPAGTRTPPRRAPNPPAPRPEPTPEPVPVPIAPAPPPAPAPAPAPRAVIASGTSMALAVGSE